MRPLATHSVHECSYIHVPRRTSSPWAVCEASKCRTAKTPTHCTQQWEDLDAPRRLVVSDATRWCTQKSAKLKVEPRPPPYHLPAASCCPLG